MNKKTAKIFLLISIGIVLVMFFYLNIEQEQVIQNYHTCIFDKNSLNINCSPELKIKEGYQRFLIKDNSNPSNGINYYDLPIYSNDSNSNLNTIYKTSTQLYITGIDGEKYKQCQNCQDPLDKNPSDFFTDKELFKFRKIEVIDTSKNETFLFYVSSSGEYNVEKDNSFELEIDLCNLNENNVCMPDKDWRCQNYDITAKACDSLVSYNNANLCYNLKKENLKNYCLSKINN